MKDQINIDKKIINLINKYYKKLESNVEEAEMDNKKILDLISKLVKIKIDLNKSNLNLYEEKISENDTNIIKNILIKLKKEDEDESYIGRFDL